MRRILLVFGSLERGGAQLRTLEVCRALHQRYPVQFDVCNLSRHPGNFSEEIEEIGSTIYHIPIRSRGFLWEFSRLFYEQQYDVVDSLPNLFSGVILTLAKMHKVPVRIANWRNSPEKYGGLTSNSLFIWLMRTLIRRTATHVAAVSRSALDDSFPPSWQSSVDCRVIYNGLTSSSFQVAVDRRGLPEEFGWPFDSRIVINVARFTQQKNHRTIVETTRLVHENFGNIRLLLVGDGELYNEITGLINLYGLQDICVMPGVRKDIPRLLLASDVFFFPSLWEGLPGALLESLAAGLPVVASDIPPIKEIAEYFPFSISMAPPYDAEKHAKHILTALDISADRASLQANFARTPFVLENAIKAYSTLYGLTDVADE